MKRRSANRSCEISAREISHQESVLKLSTQGMVLLENDGTLPLESGGNIALFGSGVRFTVKGGTGSGDVNVRHSVTVEEGFEKAGFTITSKDWLDEHETMSTQSLKNYYTDMKKIAEERNFPLQGVIFMNPYVEPDIPPVTEKHIQAAGGDTALFIISRNSGENGDRHNKKGDYQISDGERESLKLLAKHYAKLVVVLNVGGVIDTKFMQEIPGINALLLMSQPGYVAGDSLVRIITGQATPSGKLSTTWAKNYEDYPNAATFSHNNGDTTDEYYEEGIYVGYRYFDTFNVTPAYPFGYGLSYTTFDMHINSASVIGKEISLEVEVKNTGDKFSGREVVQVYYSAPEGTLEKPYQSLACFAKTDALFPGQVQTLILRFPVEVMASYSEEKTAYILEEGTYYIRVGNSSRNTQIAAAIEIEKTCITKIVSNRFMPVKPIQELSRKDVKPYSYEEEAVEKIMTAHLTFNTDEIKPVTIEYSNEIKEQLPPTDKTGLTLDHVRAGAATLDEFVAQLTVEEMANLCVGSARSNMNGATSVIGNASETVPGAAGDSTTDFIETRKIPNMILADGPAGLRLSPHFVTDSEGKLISADAAFMAMPGVNDLLEFTRPDDAIDYYQYCTAIPISTMLAQTWNTDLLEEIGAIIGAEMQEFGVTLWLAPGMNIHRNPLCGRNFEYYSEDPFLSGMCAAHTTLGIQSFPGIGTTIKHFVANNQEDNRFLSHSHMTERTLREIYLRGFEIAVKASQPMSIMSSYNCLNDTHTANDYNLLTAVARDEWGFEGIIMSDWGTTGTMRGPINEKESPLSIPSICIKAGNDLIMPGSEFDIEQIVKSVDNPDALYPITLADLQTCAKRILIAILLSNRYEDCVPYIRRFDELESFMKIEKVL